MYGVTPSGFVVKRLEDIKTEIKNKLKSVFGNNVNLDDRAPFGQFISIFAEREALVWELAEAVYNSQYPATAEGTNLDNVVSITGTVRNDATKSTAELTFIGDEGTIIPQGSIVSKQDDPDVKFETDEEATIAAGVNEIQNLSFPAVPSGGSFTMAFEGDISAAIAFSASATNIKDILEDLVTIDLVAVSGDFANGFPIEFQGGNAAEDVELLEVVTNILESKKKYSITPVADVSGSLDRVFFILESPTESVGFWIDIDDSGSSIPAGAAAADRAVEITTIATNDDAATILTKLQVAIDADASFSAVINGSDLEVENADSGEADNWSAGDSGFTFVKLNEGYSAGNLIPVIAESTKGVPPKVTVDASATVAGALAAPADSLTVLETPVSGVDSVTNEIDAVIGEDIESDSDLKLKREQELAQAGSATIEAIRARVLEVDGVTAVIVFENDTNITDLEGRPPNSIQVVAQGGTDEDVAEAIFGALAGGITSYGSIQVAVTDSQGFAQLMNFDRPTSKNVWVEFDLTVDINFFPADGVAQVEAAILAYGQNQQIGEDVVVFGSDALSCVTDEIPGITDLAIRIGFTASPVSDDNLSVAANEIAVFDSARITAQVV